MSTEKRQEFIEWFDEFLEAYPTSGDGRRHLQLYDQARRQARESFELLRQAADRGDDISDLVVLKLVPYADMEANRAKGAWVHPAPVVKADARPSPDDVSQVVAYALAEGCRDALLVYPQALSQPLDEMISDIRVRSVGFSLDGDLQEAGHHFLR